MNNLCKFFLLILIISTGTRVLADHRDSVDVINYAINIEIRQIPAKNISGTATITAKTTFNNTRSISFDLLHFEVDSVIYRDSVHLQFAQNDSVLSITFPSPVQTTDTFNLKIAYRGIASQDPRWGGYYTSGQYAFNLGVGFNSQPHNFGRAWFPCIDNFTDRATYSFHITTDKDFVAVCDGLLKDEIHHPDSSVTWHWQLDQPIPTYLAGVAVGKYAFVKHDFTGLQRTYPVWVAVEAKDTANLKASFANLDQALQCFEQKFGPYQFDRVGYVGVPFNGGAMEHATNIAYPLYAIDGTKSYETLMAHELSHHWWGNQVTCRTAADMWLNEGWASFCEALFLQCLYGDESYINDIRSKLTEVMNNAALDDRDYFAVSGVPSSATYGTHVYKKGALVVHTLRTLMGDSSFFEACKNYLLQHHFKDVSSADLLATFQQYTQVDLTDFFNNWVYSKGYTDVLISGIKTENGEADISLVQVPEKRSTYCKELPVTVTFHDANGQKVSFAVKVTEDQVLHEHFMLPSNLTPPFLATVNEDTRLALGHTTASVVVNSTGVLNPDGVMLSLNVQQVTGNVPLLIEHHWVQPVVFNTPEKGIRISPEHFWSIKGNYTTSTLSAWAFFNYDGSSPLKADAELNIVNEDSLVLLYRPNENSEWNIHTDYVQQAGSKTDKIGRFWAKNVLPGEYAIGKKDQTVTSINEVQGVRRRLFITPNPASRYAQVSTNNHERITAVDLVDLNGKVIETLNFMMGMEEVTISVPAIPGAYCIVRAYTENGMFTGKLYIKP